MFGVVNLKDSEEPMLTVHGKPVDKEAGSVIGKSPSSEEWYIHIDDAELFKQIIKHKTSEIAKGCRRVGFSTSIYPSEGFTYFWVSSIFLSNNKDSFELAFEFGIDIDNWKNLWSVLEHLKEFYFCVNKRNNNLFPSDAGLSDELSWMEFEIYTVFAEDDSSLSNRITEITNIFCAAHDEALIKLSEKANSEILIRRFNFPLEVKVACEQYLLYFTEFLRDVGIAANASLKEEYGNVLFSVKPDDKDEALENIKIALEIYLNLPNISALNTPQSLDFSLPVQRLSSQVQFLQSQITLANATIQQQNFLIAQQNQFIQSQQFSSQVLIDSIKAEDEVDKEPLVGKIISIKEFEWGPLNLGLPELLRRMKEHFKKI